MESIGNILWLFLGGFFIASVYFLVGLVMCATIVGIPFGIQHFKLALSSIFPFGKEIR